MNNLSTNLLERLQHPDRNVRSYAAKHLSDGHLNGERDTSGLDALLDALRTETDFFVREDLVWSLARFGEMAVQPLIDLLGDPEPVVRHGAAHTLSKIGDTRAVEPLIERLNDPDPVVLAKVVFALGQLRDARAIPALIGLLGYPHDEVQTMLNATFTSFGAEAVPMLMDMTLHTDLYVREHAVDVLGLIGDQSALPALIDALRDDEWQARFSAVTALGHVGGAEARAAVEGMQNDDDELVRALVPKVLKTMKVKRV